MLKYLAEKARNLLPCLAMAALSGVLMGLTYPPFEVDWLIWLALVPMLWVIRRERRNLNLFLTGFVTGLVFYLIINQSLTSSEGWTGWVVNAGPGAREEIIGRQSVALKFLWFMLSAWCGLFWGAFSMALARIAKGSLVRMAFFAPPLVILMCEWLRSVTTWDYQWGFLGNAALGVEPVAQIGAVGGIWLLSWLVVLVNVGVLSAFALLEKPRVWPLTVAILAVSMSVIVGGLARVGSVENKLSKLDGGLDVAAILFFEPKTVRENYTPLGLERAYLELMGLVARGDAGQIDLIVLPESVAVGALSIDGSKIPDVSPQIQWPLEDWQQAVSWVMSQSRTDVDIVIGLDTVSDGKLHNSLVFWDGGEIQKTYHKQRLVPFSEYQPEILGLLGMRGRMQYYPGDSSQLATLQDVKIGGFICQEVQIPNVIRRSVRDGAELLVSGGNDGVFANPAVAKVHANMARLRAIESGRFIVRAMKTGISAIISPTGREISRSASSESSIVVDQIHPLHEITPYVRFGNWPLGLALILLLVGIPSAMNKNATRN